MGTQRERMVPGLPRQASARSPGDGLLVVRADLPARVSVDGVDVGSTEGFVPIRLPQGSYRVEVRVGGKMGAMDVHVEAGHATPVLFQLRGRGSR